MIRTLMLAALFTFTAGSALAGQPPARNKRVAQTVQGPAGDEAKETGKKAKRERKSKKKTEGEAPAQGRAR